MRENSFGLNQKELEHVYNTECMSAEFYRMLAVDRHYRELKDNPEKMRATMKGWLGCTDKEPKLCFLDQFFRKEDWPNDGKDP